MKLVFFLLVFSLVSGSVLGRGLFTHGQGLDQDQYSDDPHDPINSLATAYELTKDQKDALEGLYLALAAVAEDRKTDQASIIQKDLLVIADDASKADKSTIASISEMLAYSMAHISLEDRFIRQYARDLWLIFNMSTVKSGSLLATADLCDRLQKGGLEPAYLTRLRKAFDVIIFKHPDGSR